jgi:hypothetical protein
LGTFAKGAANVGLGALGAVAAPISATYRSFAGQPIEDVTGIPREYTEFAAQLATPGIGLTGKAPVPAVTSTRALTPGQEATAAAARLSETGAPVQIPRAAASENLGVQQAGKIVSNVPYAGTPLVKASESTIQQLGTKADEISQAYGSGASVAETGGNAAKSITDWITGESKANTDRLYNKVDRHIKPDVMTPLDNTLSVASEIAAKRSAAGLPAGKAIETILPAIQRGEGLSYEGIKTLRTKIGEVLDQGILPADVSGGELKQIYGALTKDLGRSVAASGPEAVSAFNRANKYYSLVSDRREALAKIVGTQGNAAPEQVFERLVAMAGSSSRADINRLAQARKVMGKADWNEVASTVVSRLGRDVEGNFTPDRFVTAYSKLSDAGKNILFKSTDQKLAPYLDDIAQVSSRFKQLNKFANPSGTARNVIGGGLGAAIFVEPLTVLTTLVGNRVAANALAKPASAASVAKWSRANEAWVRTPTPSKMAAYALATRNLISTLGDKNVTPGDFVRAIQGPQQSQNNP